MFDFTTIKSFLLDKELSATIETIKSCATDNTDTTTLQDYVIKLPNITGQPVILGQDVITDIELFNTYNNNNSTESVIKALAQPLTFGGSKYLTHILSTPICDQSTLKKRQALLREVATISSELTPHLQQLKQSENTLSWIYNSDKEELISMCDIVYFTTWLTRPLNTSDKALTSYNIYRMLLNPTIGIISPIMYVFVPFLVLRNQLKIPMPFTTYIRGMFNMMFSSNYSLLPPSMNFTKYISIAFTVIFYFQSVFNSIEMAMAVNRICKLINEKINGFAAFIKAVEMLDAILGPCQLTPFLADPPLEYITKEFQLVRKIDHTKPYSLLSNFGAQLKVFRQLDRSKFIPYINRAYAIDALASIVNTQTSSKNYCYAQYTIGGPSQEAQGLWHPCLNPNTVIKNDFTSTNAIITGPNAGGKSTFIKSVLIATLLSQTLTIAPATYFTIRPYNHIKSQINIPDCKGKESLFEAEMYRSKANLDTLASLPADHTALIVMDEIFNSTNPVEGIAGAYAIAKHMAAYPNATCIITTHYLYLTKLAKELPNSFKNYKMNVTVDPITNAISYPYKITPGVSRQYIALELLRKNGFDDALISDAIGIKNRLTTVTRPRENSVKDNQDIQDNNTNKK